MSGAQPPLMLHTATKPGSARGHADGPRTSFPRGRGLGVAGQARPGSGSTTATETTHAAGRRHAAFRAARAGFPVVGPDRARATVPPQVAWFSRVPLRSRGSDTSGGAFARCRASAPASRSGRRGGGLGAGAQAPSSPPDRCRGHQAPQGPVAATEGATARTGQPSPATTAVPRRVDPA